MEVMIVNGTRYLINTQASAHVVDQTCEDILKHYPQDVTVEWDENVTRDDIMPLTLSQLKNK